MFSQLQLNLILDKFIAIIQSSIFQNPFHLSGNMNPSDFTEERRKSYQLFVVMISYCQLIEEVLKRQTWLAFHILEDFTQVFKMFCNAIWFLPTSSMTVFLYGFRITSWPNEVANDVIQFVTITLSTAISISFQIGMNSIRCDENISIFNAIVH